MNALVRKMMTVGKSSTGCLFLGVASTAALLSGCAGFPIASVKVDPSSPVAGDVAKIASAQKSFPSFNDIPPAPTDVRPVRQYGERAAAVEAARDQLEAATAPSTWTLGNTQAFTAQARSQAGPDYNATAADTEAFANTVRKRATPPPPANP
jgi:hypothetical protein